MFQDDRHLKIFSEFCYSSEITLSVKTVAFVEITRQTFCSYAVAFLFLITTKFDFLLWLFRSTQRHCFLVFNFSAKNWKNCNASIKKTGRNAKHMILWLGLTKWQFRCVMLPSKPDLWRAYWSLCCFKVRVHLQSSVRHLGHRRA